MKVQYTEFVTA